MLAGQPRSDPFHHIRTGSRPHLTSRPMKPKTISQGVNYLEHEDDLSPPPNANIF